MGFMKHFRRKTSKHKEDKGRLRSDFQFPAASPYRGPDCTQRLPDTVLRRIFELVCPHSTDESYDSSEESGNDGCMSCDTRDLAHCALTKRQWYSVAAGLL